MSFTDYVNHMTQKYCLAVAIAVLNSKPEDLSIEQYLSALRSSVNNENNNDMDAHLDISVCSDDFRVDHDGNATDDLVTSLGDDDDSVTILKDFNMNDEMDVSNVETNSTSEVGANNVDHLHSKAPQASNVAYDNNSNDLENFGIQCNIEPNNTIVTCIDKDRGPNNNLAAVILKNIDREVNLNDIQGSNTCLTVDNKYLDINKTMPGVDATPKKIKNKNNYMDLEFGAQSEYANYNIKLATKIHKNITKEANLIENINKEQKILNLRKPLDLFNNKSYKEHSNTTNDNRNGTQKHLNIKTAIIQRSSKNYKDQNKITTTALELLTNSEQINVHNQELTKKIYKNINICDVNQQHDSQATQFYSWDGFTHNITQISQSQSENILIGEKFIHGIRPTNRLDGGIDKTSLDNKNNHFNKDIANTAIENENRDTYNLEDRNEQTYIENENNHINKDLADTAIANDKEGQMEVENVQTTTVKLNPSEIQYILVETVDGTYRLLKENVEDLIKTAHERQIILELNDRQPEMYKNYTNTTNIDSQITNAQELPTFNQTMKDIETTEEIATSHTKNIETAEDIERTEDLASSDEDMTSSRDVVPFKVMEELNKVKVYLNRKERSLSADGNSADSGYRSNCNSGSCKSVPISWNALDQSAHCLYSHLMESPLVGATQDILKEISQVLGRLIDMLHDEEKYPSFIQDVLSTAKSLLHDLYTGPTSDDNVLLKKDEDIQRLSLLNRSLHITEYTIEKITLTLEQMHMHLTTEDTYELINIDEVENLAYVFHILEIVIKRYKSLKTKNTSTQATQSTQSQVEDKNVLKKSSIADIWKKKWTPNLVVEERVEGEEKVCCLTKCGVVLNKIIVDCMEGYSLVSFAALQCFNLLQAE